MSFRSVGFCGSGYDACTSQNVPPLSAQMRIEWSGTTVIVGCACTFSRDEYRLLLGLGEPPSLLVTVRKMDGRVGRTSDDATRNWLHASRHAAFAPSEWQRVQLTPHRTLVILKFHFPQHYIERRFEQGLKSERSTSWEAVPASERRAGIPGQFKRSYWILQSDFNRIVRCSVLLQKSMEKRHVWR